MGQSADEVGAVDRKSFGEDKNQFRPRAGKLGAEPDAGSRGIGGGVDARRRGGEVRLLKLRNRDDQRPVGDQVIVDFASARATDDRAFREGEGELVERLGRIGIPGRTKGDDQRPGGVALRRKRGRPTRVQAMGERLDMHVGNPIPQYKAISGPKPGIGRARGTDRRISALTREAAEQ